MGRDIKSVNWIRTSLHFTAVSNKNNRKPIYIFFSFLYVDVIRILECTIVRRTSPFFPMQGYPAEMRTEVLYIAACRRANPMGPLRTNKISIECYRARAFDGKSKQNRWIAIDILRRTTVPDKRHSSHSRQSFREYLVQEVNQVQGFLKNVSDFSTLL